MRPSGQVRAGSPVLRRHAVAAAALATIGAAVFLLLGDAVGEPASPPGDRGAGTQADRLAGDRALDAARVLTDLGGFPVVVVVVAATAAWRGRRRRADAAVLVASFAITWILVQLAKAGYARPRPPRPHATAAGMAYPSGHAANAVAWIACAALTARAAARGTTGAAVVASAVGVALLVGATRIYLRVHYLSDVVGGYALAAAVYGGLGCVALLVGAVRHNGAARP